MRLGKSQLDLKQINEHFTFSFVSFWGMSDVELHSSAEHSNGLASRLEPGASDIQNGQDEQHHDGDDDECDHSPWINLDGVEPSYGGLY